MICLTCDLKRGNTSGSCVLLSPVTIKARYAEIYLQYVYYNLLVHVYLLSLVLCISLGTLQLSSKKKTGLEILMLSNFLSK